MEKLEKLLTNPFEQVETGDLNGFQQRCFDIAKELFCNYCINCDGKEFYLAEIEFYYWQKKNWNNKWNRMTYPRECEAKVLFFHLSGIDICFNSHYKKEDNFDDEACFGGILIRAIRDKENNIIAGPWNCMLKILNECQGRKMPKLIKLETPCNNEKNIEDTYRSLGKEDMQEEKEMAERKDNPLKLCFYDSSITTIKWGKQTRVRLCKSTGELEKSVTNVYKLDRFTLKE